jgi:phosphoserine phosphatase RsbU/P
MPRNANLIRALLAALVGFTLANLIELAIVRAAAPSVVELTWISDVILSTAFGWAVYLFLHLRQTQGELSQLERQRVALETELTLAADIQRRLLPSLPEALGGIAWAARLRGARQIGGDFYDFVQVEPDVVLLIVADISGKGIPAAQVLPSLRTMFRTLAGNTRDPAALLESLSRALYEDHGGQPYATAIVCSFDLRDRTLNYANAGHPPGAIIGTDRRRIMSVGGIPAGMLPGSVYESETIPLQLGDIGVILTDGITEPMDRSAVEISESALSRLTHPITARGLCDEVMASADYLAASPVLEPDDRTVVAFLVGGA